MKQSEIQEEFKRFHEKIAKINSISKRMYDIYDIYYKPSGTVGNHVMDDKHGLKDVIFELHIALLSASNQLDYLAKYAKIGLNSDGLSAQIIMAGSNWEVLHCVKDHEAVIKRIYDQYRIFSGYVYKLNSVNAYLNRVNAMDIAKENQANQVKA